MNWAKEGVKKTNWTIARNVDNVLDYGVKPCELLGSNKFHVIFTLYQNNKIQSRKVRHHSVLGAYI